MTETCAPDVAARHADARGCERSRGDAARQGRRESDQDL